MMNLLPPEQKKRLVHVYRERLFVVTAVMVGVAALFSTVVAWISFVSLGIEKDILTKSIASRNEAPSAEEGRIAEKDIIETKEALTLLSSDGDKERVPVVVIEKVFSEQKDIVIEGISYSVSSEGDVSVAVQGIAPSRSALIDFSVRLEHIGFLGTRVPVSSFVEESDIPFSLSMTY
ncbi:MAG: hypothetical protein HGB03_03635 [Candidatus Yonathbacteria bacterium]|nr:hypothetical protein [Candidatus Yonathbacteria bacterium]NTW47674.1 hypothetical protein [Candidatus Yonathbacteria bacterium]